ncbi:Class II Aldolase and Adducin N-terminal domain, putative [Novosphingobium nitrogenifigens DSM 19370]|uniref:Class II Aldolase and Adducin N-terminal domain, putative n=1 Tax=Novosphingobium nitrogenifigens DSM 19370 TaxID=983920 RepID=F1ZAM3_9SPHN|nr:class II aldolase/adducin family protein [Novosphingobium nitrogenifigens]EGD58340.1 Class II Aldolase and Adducin N-terminal domain, putative [Novosphingobium nitrogenifigens DSM 19370]
MNAQSPLPAAPLALPIDEAALRIDLAAAFRLAARFGWHESVGNHFSATLSTDGRRFLMNRKWQHFATVRASDLQALDADDGDVMQRPDAPDASAWCIHGNAHRRVPEARVILHCHPIAATTLTTLSDPRLLPIDQNTARFFGRYAVDLECGGIADQEEEGIRIAGLLATAPHLVMANHGVTVTAETVAEAFEHLYFFEKAAETLLRAYATGKPLSVMTDAVAERTATGWDAYRGMAFAHFDYLKSCLDADDPSYRD